MTVAVPSRRQSAVSPSPLTAAVAAALPVPDVLDRVGSGPEGLSEDEAKRRLQTIGLNAVRSHRARAWPVLARQPVRRNAGLPAAPRPVLLALVVMVVAYLLMIELGKYWFYRSSRTPTAAPPRRSAQARRPRVHRRAARFTTHHRLR